MEDDTGLLTMRHTHNCKHSLSSAGSSLGFRPMGGDFSTILAIFGPQNQEMAFLGLKTHKRAVKWCFYDYLDQVELFKACYKP